MDKINNFCVSVDGLPYVGKTTLCQCLRKIDKKRLVIDDGVIKSATLARCTCNAEPDYASLKNIIVVYLLATKDDWTIRCPNDEIANRYEEIATEMNKTAQKLDDAGINVLVYNTTKYTPYMIAKDILKVIETLEKPNNDSNISATA